jgi:transposase
MEILYSRCCGLDVHAKTVVACLCIEGEKPMRTFSTMTADLLHLVHWLLTSGCTHVALESTGVYWRPVFNGLEGHFAVLLVNAHHSKAVPGRKTDGRECDWLGDLRRHGLLKASSIPPRYLRELRELTRHRQILGRDRAAVAKRSQKLIESANIKLGQVATNVLGLSGRWMLQALAAGGAEAERLAQLAEGKLKAKAAQLKPSLTGHLPPTQRFLLQALLRQYDPLDAAMARTTTAIQRQLHESPEPFLPQAIDLLQTIPGIGARGAATPVSEIGTDLTHFPPDSHLAAWAGMGPGNHASAGKQLSGHPRKGNVYVRGALTQGAWAATRTKHT